jgi:hypothetical protein
MECVPSERELIVSVALPALSAVEPIGVEPSRNTTVPVAVPAAEETIALNVTGLWSRTAEADAVRLMADAAELTTWDSAGDVAGSQAELPL